MYAPLSVIWLCQQKCLNEEFVDSLMVTMVSPQSTVLNCTGTSYYVCPLEHGGQQAEVRWISVVAKIEQDFNSDIH